MKNLIQYIFDGVLTIAVIVLFVLVINCRNCKQNCCSAKVGGDSSSVSIAYVQMDSLTSKWNLYNELNQELLKEEETSSLKLKQQTDAFQAEVADFQQKASNGIYSSQQRMQSEQERLIKKEQQLQQLSEKLQRELMVKNQNMTLRLKNTIDSTIAAYNADGHYQFIFSDNSNTSVLYGAPCCNITNEILDILNAQ